MLHKVRQESGRPQGLPENYYLQGWRIFVATRHGPCSKRLPLTLQRKNEARKRGRNKSMGFNQFSDEYTFLPASGVDIKVPGQQERKISREVTNLPTDNNSCRGCPCVLGAGRGGKSAIKREQIQTRLVSAEHEQIMQIQFRHKRENRLCGGYLVTWWAVRFIALLPLLVLRSPRRH